MNNKSSVEISNDESSNQQGTAWSSFQTLEQFEQDKISDIYKLIFNENNIFLTNEVIQEDLKDILQRVDMKKLTLSFHQELLSTTIDTGQLIKNMKCVEIEKFDKENKKDQNEKDRNEKDRKDKDRNRKSVQDNETYKNDGFDLIDTWSE